MEEQFRSVAAALALIVEALAAVLIAVGAISPTWQQIGQLAVIAVIRTFLNYFLEKDIERYSDDDNLAPAAPSRKDAA